MTMIAYATMNKVILDMGHTEPGTVLTKINEELNQLLVTRDDGTAQGMDVCLCVIDRRMMRLEFAGASRKLLFIRNGILSEIAGDKFPIGGYTDKTYSYNTNSILLQQGDQIYLTSDGYADQFGGLKGGKFMMGRLKRELTDLANLSMDEQHRRLTEILEEWKGDYPQTDDICVIGVRF